MDIQLYAKALFEVIEQINPKLKSLIDAGTSLYTIGSAGVKVLQQGKQLITYAVGSAKQKPAAPKSKKPKKSAHEILFQKSDVAVVVEISRPAIRDVVNYLESRKIDANLVVITMIKPRGSKPVKGLSESRPAQWTELVQEFSMAIDKVKRELGSARVHIFLSAPLALVFGLGAVWGTVDQAQVYHWKSKGGYAPLMKISRSLRFKE